MALGLPVISTNVGGIPYLVAHEENGVLVDKNDVKGMSKAIVELFNQPARRDNLILNGRKLAETFDWNLVKKQWNEILRN